MSIAVEMAVCEKGNKKIKKQMTWHEMIYMFMRITKDYIELSSDRLFRKNTPFRVEPLGLSFLFA